VGRFLLNSTFGLGGIFDLASDLQIDRNTKDFGHTLGYWGVGPGPYLVLPLMGPSTLRDTVALPVDTQGSLTSHVSHVPTRNTVRAVDLIDRREGLLKATEMLEQVALDPYTFTRDAHLQRRRSAVYNGNPPDDIRYDEPLAVQPKDTP
jgi:phospholipid-binding lipoprotein MlaA